MTSKETKSVGALLIQEDIEFTFCAWHPVDNAGALTSSFSGAP